MLKVKNNTLFQGLLRVTAEYKQKFNKTKVKDFTPEEAAEYQAANCYLLAQMATAGVPLVKVQVTTETGYTGGSLLNSTRN